MSLNSGQNYFEYKKSKMLTSDKSPEEGEKPISKVNYLFQLFVVTFVIIFVAIVISIMKYSTKMDIEYTQGDLKRNSEIATTIPGYGDIDDEKGTIDERLKLIQQEENAPSEARIIQKTNENEQVIAKEHVEEAKKQDKIEKLKEQNAKSELNQGKDIKQEVQKTATKTQIAAKTAQTAAPVAKPKTPEKTNALLGQIKTKSGENNVTITSKVLIGRYSSFEEASKIQNAIKEKDPTSAPFVRKVGDVYSVQTGSYNDFYIAKTQAQKFKAQGWDVWIYQQ